MEHYQISLEHLRRRHLSRIYITPVFEIFNNEVHKSTSLAKALTNFKEFRSGKYRPISKKIMYLIAENSFLKLFVSWEQFLEQTFIRYMCGGETSSRYSPRRFVQPPSLEHALNFIKQARPYADWTVWDEVIARARLCFGEGKPFTNASGGEAQLGEMKIVRNRIAHSSKHSKKKFQELVLQKLGYPPRARGWVPGRLLLSRVPPTNTKTVIQEYGDLVIVLGNLIVP